MVYAWLAVTLLVLHPVYVESQGRQSYQLGGTGGLDWEASGSLHYVDVLTRPGSVQPVSADPDVDLIPLMFDFGGGVRALGGTDAIAGHWASDNQYIIDGDPETAFIHPPRPNLLGGLGSFFHMDMRFDLGAPFPVQRIRFFTRPSHPEHLIRQYRLWTNDGSRDTQDQYGDPIWTVLRDEPHNLNAVVELEAQSRMVRYIRLRPEQGERRGGTDYTWELAGLEVYGRGYTPSASFTTDVIDLGAASSLGQIWWAGHRDPEARLLIQTRTGLDDQPNVYWRKTGIGDREVPYDEAGNPLTEETYRRLPSRQQGRITPDTENWSVWQTYEYEHGLKGTRILSPSPRQYLQIRLDFMSRGMQGAHIDSLGFEYSQPPLASRVIGEIYPYSVEPSTTVHFTCYLRARLEPGQRGFNAVELRTEAQLAAILAVRIDQQSVDFTVNPVEGTPGGVLLRIPRVVDDQTRIDIEFEGRVFRYGTAFDVVVVDTEDDGIPLAAVPGNVVDEVLSSALTVRTQQEAGMLDVVRVSPNPFSPNGDGINDHVTFAYSVIRLTRDTPVETSIYTLSGRRVRRLTTIGGSAAYEIDWDGRDENGQRVPPGVYVYRIQLDTDSGKEAHMGTLGVVY